MREGQKQAIATLEEIREAIDSTRAAIGHFESGDGSREGFLEIVRATVDMFDGFAFNVLVGVQRDVRRDKRMERIRLVKAFANIFAVLIVFAVGVLVGWLL